MSWETSHDQWVAWTTEEPVPPTPAGVAFDPVDEALLARLDRFSFPGADDETVVSAAPVAPQPEGSIEDMATVVRSAPQPTEDDDESAKTLTHARVPPSSSDGEYEVTLVSASGQVDVELEPGTPQPVYEAGSEPVEPPSENDADGLYIPDLTRAATEAAAAPALAEPVATAPVEPAAEPAAAEPAAAEPAVPQPVEPIEATPPDPEPIEEIEPEDSAQFHADQSAASSQTAGEIVTLEADDSLTEDVIEIESVVTPSSGRVVIADALTRGAQGDLHRAFDEDEEAETLDPAALEEEPDELDASDLVEEAEGEEPPPPPKQASDHPPPVPPRPPTTNEASAEPTIETQAALAELHAEVGGIEAEAPADEGPRTWYDEVFDDHYAALLRPGNRESAEAEARFFLHSAKPSPGAHLLDIGCGDGAHALALAKEGYYVTGVDASLSQLLRASQANEAARAGVAFLQGDMRDPPVRGPFEGVLCLGSTLGFFSEEENLRSLSNMHDMLTLGGKLLLEVFNRDHIISRLPARSWWQGRGCLVLDEAHMDYFSNRLKIHRTIVFEDGRQYEHHIDMSAYAVHDLVRMCRAVGLRVLEVSGSRHTRGRFYGATSPDIWLLAERPEP